MISQFDTKSILGNWSGNKNKKYHEYLFTEDKLYVYKVGMGNLYEYNYKIKHDSLFVSRINGEDVKELGYNFLDKIVKIDSSKLFFEALSFEKIKDTINLEMYINNNIDYEVYDSQSLYRESLLFDADSLFKWAGDPIDLNAIK